MFFVLAVIGGLLLSPFAVLAAPTGNATLGQESYQNLVNLQPDVGSVAQLAAQEPDQILVKFQPGTDEIAKGNVHRKHGGGVIDTIPGIDVQVVRVQSGKAREKANAYKNERAVRFAEPDYVVAVDPVVVNDPKLVNQWALPKIQAPEAWSLSQGNAVRIAILDTGIDQNHEDLKGRIVENKSFSRSKSVDDKFGHGTHVAGSASAITNNGIGVAGVGFNALLMNVKVLDDNGFGTISSVSNGIIYAADRGAQVISLSLGGSGADTMKNAVTYANGKGALVVAAAGNSNTSAQSFPAAYPEAIAVAATDLNDVKASFSNFGTWVDVAAPGVDIYSTFPNHRNRLGGLNYGALSGTSMATPHVSGVAALVFATIPTWTSTTNALVRARIVDATRTDPTTGFDTAMGRVNAYKAVQP